VSASNLPLLTGEAETDAKTAHTDCPDDRRRLEFRNSRQSVAMADGKVGGVRVLDELVGGVEAHR